MAARLMQTAPQKLLRLSVSRVFVRGLQTKRHTPNDPVYIQKSVIPTMHFQKSLPRLPIPTLDESLDNYLNVVTPLMKPDELKATREAVESFRKNEGPKLHADLIAHDKRNKHTSYISDPWYEMYLAGRDPIAINVNPFLLLPRDEELVAEAGPRAQALRAARTVNASLRFRNSLVDSVLVPDIFHTKPEKSMKDSFETLAKLVPGAFSWYFAYFNGAYPLDMSQYAYLFGTTRIPMKFRDELRTHSDSRHITVIYRGHLYAVDVFHADGKTPFSIPELEGVFASILESDIEHAGPDGSVGLLTSENRDVWAEARDNLIAAGNTAALDQIERGLFAVCLDDTTATTHAGLAMQFLCGGENRWYDKSFQLIISNTSDTCINFEHAWGDGVAVLRYILDMTHDAQTPRTMETPIAPSKSPEPLCFTLNDKVRSTIKQAKVRLETQAASLDFITYEFKEFGKNLIKKHKISPDGVAQMSFQLAFFYTHGHAAASYESASTAGFKHGRTETVRPCSTESQEWVVAMSKGEGTVDGLRTAVNVHSKRTKDALMGKGMDRHLFALRHYAHDKHSLPTLFEDPAYARVNHIRVSTSTLNTDAIALGGFGPTSQDGYGIGYLVADDYISAGVSSYIGSQKFIDNLHRALHEIGELFNKSA